LLMAQGSWLRAHGGLAAGAVNLEPGDFPFNGREQVVDVIALEETLAKRFERCPLLRRWRMLPFDVAQGELTVPARAQLLQLPLVFVAFRVNRLPGIRETGQQPFGVLARFAQLTYLVEFLVEREHFLE